jgi:predicted PurR-regulated permease PerM
MTDPAPDTEQKPERRRVERRTTGRLSELTLPEVRRILLTTTLGVIVLGLFVWMVREVIIAAILGVVIAFYLRPVYGMFTRTTGSKALSAITTIVIVIVPVLALLVYAYVEFADVAAYVAANQRSIAAKIDDAVHRLPFLETANTYEWVQRVVRDASNYGARIPALLQETLAEFSIGATIFLFTAFYILVDGEKIVAYVRGKIPPRYSELAGALEHNVRGVLYGAVYSTLVTQTLKSAILLVLFIAFGVPLAPMLAILAFVIGFFPIVGSWSVYMPVAGWLVVFADKPAAAVTLVLVGGLVNTLFISNYLRPKLAAERSRVLNFYWMFVGLVTGVFTFGLAGILLGPILIGLLKAIVDTVTAQASWRILDDEEGDEEAA